MNPGAYAVVSVARARHDRAPAAGRGGCDLPWNLPVQLPWRRSIRRWPRATASCSNPPNSPRTRRRSWRSCLVAQFFAPDEFCVVQGDAATAALVASLPFDHLVFTGSTAVGGGAGRAAANLTPTTLELGGKSPCHHRCHCDLREAAPSRSSTASCSTPGRPASPPTTCRCRAAARRRLCRSLPRGRGAAVPRIAGNPDYASIISPRHLARLRPMQQAQTQGPNAGA